MKYRNLYTLISFGMVVMMLCASCQSVQETEVAPTEAPAAETKAEEPTDVAPAEEPAAEEPPAEMASLKRKVAELEGFVKKQKMKGKGVVERTFSVKKDEDEIKVIEGIHETIIMMENPLRARTTMVGKVVK